jgi:hypothetical protein
VDNILTVWARALSQPAVLAIVLEMEEFKHTPFDSILKMYTIVSKAQNPAAIKWVFLALADLTQAGALGPGQVPLLFWDTVLLQGQPLLPMFWYASKAFRMRSSFMALGCPS